MPDLDKNNNHKHNRNKINVISLLVICIYAAFGVVLFNGCIEGKISWGFNRFGGTFFKTAREVTVEI